MLIDKQLYWTILSSKLKRIAARTVELKPEWCRSVADEGNSKRYIDCKDGLQSMKSYDIFIIMMARQY